MNKIYYKVIIIGLVISWGVVIPLIFILSLLDTTFKFDWTETFLLRFVPIYSQVVAGGIYIGITKARNKILHAAIVGLLLDLSIKIYAYIKFASPFHLDLIGVSRAIKYMLICAVTAWLTGKIIDLMTKNNKTKDKING